MLHETTFTVSENAAQFDALVVEAPRQKRVHMATDGFVPGRAESAGRLHDAVARFNGRVLATVGWEEAIDRLEATAAAPLLLLDARGVSETLVATTLYRLDGIASGRGLPVVAGISRDQIDLAGAGLASARAILLCDPQPLDWTLAVAAWRAEHGAVLHDRVAESEAARLARLNDEVARIADILARMSRNDAATPCGAVSEMPQRFGERPQAMIAIDPAAIRQVIRSRRLREKYFGKGLFEDPAWDMMLDLFAAHLERAQVSVSSLCIAAAVAPTTALRWISKMTDAGLFERQPDPFDRRRAFMALSKKARDGMLAYVGTARSLGLPIA